MQNMGSTAAKAARYVCVLLAGATTLSSATDARNYCATESRVGANFVGAIGFLLDQSGARRLLTQTDVGSVVMILPAATETSNRPRDHCLGFHDDQGTSPAGPPLLERNPKESVDVAQ